MGKCVSDFEERRHVGVSHLEVRRRGDFWGCGGECKKGKVTDHVEAEKQVS